MFTEQFPRRRHERTGSQRGMLVPEALFQDIHIITRRDETDLLAFRLLGGRQAEIACALSHFRLRQFTEREHQSWQQSGR
jgi:hypothetical protein